MSEALERLCQAAGVETGYVGGDGRRVISPTESVMAALRELGHDVHRPDDAADALRAHEAAISARACEPVMAARDPDRTVDRALVVDVDGRETPLHDAGDGRFSVPPDVPHGVYEARAGDESTMLMVAPRACWRSGVRRLGAMAPLYALPASDGALATYADLGAMTKRLGACGVDVFGVLPLTATFLDEPFDPSPYSPISRSRWSELFVETGADADASQGLIDYRAQWRRKRADLALMAAAAFASDERRRAMLEACRKDPGLVRYAAFRAWCERQRTPWTSWREPLPVRPLESWLEDETFRLYVCAQTAAAEQVAAAHRAGCGLYLDLPVGASPIGFDVWEAPEAYASSFSFGAPPDALSAQGQCWGFRAPLPQAGRAEGHESFRRLLDVQMSTCSALRLDHVMMLHRLFWIPDGGDGADGVYVRYPADELYAAIAIASHRFKVDVIGEDLGVVPQEVRDGMADWGVLGMHVAQFELGGSASPRSDQLACLNTHDTPTFAAFWTGEDIEQAVALGLLSSRDARRQRRERRRLRRKVRRTLDLPRWRRGSHDAEHARNLLLDKLSSSDAALALVTLEDLWLERAPQNMPGVPNETHPNWRRRFDSRVDLDDACSMLGRLSTLRGGR